MIKVYAKRREIIRLGRSGTRGVRQIIFDFTPWVDMFGAGNIQLVARRPEDAAPYLVPLQVIGEKAIWNITDADTANAGDGECELQYYVNDDLEKSEIYQTYVEKAMDVPGDAPEEPAKGYYDKVIDAAIRVENAVVKGPIIFAGTWWVWDFDKGAYVDTGVIASGGENSDGEDGFSPVVEVVETDNGHRVTITDAQGPKEFEVKNGETPVKGEDYFTAEDKAELVEQVIEEMPETSWDDLTDRPFGEDASGWVSFAKYTQTYTNSSFATKETWSGNFSHPTPFTEGKKYKIVARSTVYGISVELTGEYVCSYRTIGGVMHYYDLGTLNSDSPSAQYFGGAISFYFEYQVNFVGSHSWEIEIFEQATVVYPLDEKYIPSSIARTSDIPDVSDKVTAPATASVGQTIAVKAVDENGKPTEWEAVDFPEGGGVQSDWNQNDESQPDFVKNRPFYKYTETTVTRALLASGTYTSESIADYGGAFGAVVPTDDSVAHDAPFVHDIVFDGVEYNGLEMYRTAAGYLLGNGALLAPLFEAYGLEPPADTGEPFVLTASPDEFWTSITLVTDLTQSTTHELTLTYVKESSEEVTVKLPEEYYDRGVGAVDETSGGTGEIFNSYSGNLKNVASGVYSHAQGVSTTASGESSCAEGRYTVASGNDSHAGGKKSTASGETSFAYGYDVVASGTNSFAVGESTIAASIHQHVIGACNVEDAMNKYIHITGNGDNPNSRSNAHTLDWNGVGWYAGGLKVGGSGQDDAEAKTVLLEGDVYSKDEIDEKIGDGAEDGFSPTVSVSTIEGGHRVTVTDVNGDTSFDVMDGADGQQGEQGIQGEVGPAGADGQNGADGYTPVRGTDYWTDADQQAIIAAVLANFTDVSQEGQ